MQAELLEVLQSDSLEEAGGTAAVHSLSSTTYLSDVSILFFDLQTTAVKQLWMPHPRASDSSLNSNGSSWLSVIAEASGPELAASFSK